MIPQEQIFAHFKKELDLDLIRRVERIALHIVQEIKRAFATSGEILVRQGAGGGIGGILSQVQTGAEGILAVIGYSKAADYLKFINDGVKPWPGADWPAHKKQPPTKPIFNWITKSGLAIPEFQRNRAEFNRLQTTKKRVPKAYRENPGHPWYSPNAQLVWAFTIARKIKLKGRPGLRIVEATLKLQQAKIKQLLESAAV